MKKNRRESVVQVLSKELAALETEEADLKRQLQAVQSIIKDLKQAVLTLQSSTVHLPLSAKLFDGIQRLGRFATANDIGEELLRNEPFLDARSLKRDVNSVLARMKKKGAVAVLDDGRVQHYGLLDWLDAKGQPLDKFRAGTA